MRYVVVLVTVFMLTSIMFCSAEQVWVDRVEDEGNLMVPIRTIFEPFGAQLGWEARARAVTITAPAMNIRLPVGSREAMVNGSRVLLPVATREIGGRTYVPFSFAQRVLEGKIQYRDDRIEMPTVGRTVMLGGTSMARGAQTPAPQPAAAGQISITSPRDGATVGSRVEVRGTAPPGALVILETDVRLAADNTLLRTVPGIRNRAPMSGNWHFAIAAPVLPPAVAEPLTHEITARYVLGGRESETVTVRVNRAQ